MKDAPILSIREATISFAQKVIFEDLTFHIFPKDRVCLIGKNGAGKSTIMNCVTGNIELDEGERFINPNAGLGYLTQSERLPEGLTILEYISTGLQLDDHKAYLVDIVCEKLKLNKQDITSHLSGGQARRVNLAKTLVLEPEILLLDEPTNHLDLEIIEWLENYLNQEFKGALLVISHDRRFLEKVSNKVFWLRAGKIKVNEQGYESFDVWSSYIIDQEVRELDNLQKKLELESGWLQTGVTARRKRNIGRLHHLNDLRRKFEEQRRLVKANQSKIKIATQKIEEDSPQLIASFNNVSKTFEEKEILQKFSLKILRGERIGIIGKNGSGKSTFLKLLIGEIEPDAGTVKRAKDLQFSYFDQVRSLIKQGSTIKNILCESGAEYINLANGKSRHVCSYMKDFMFDPTEIETAVSTLSGGQQNRLLLAKTLANPSNFMILDEPTNDLDMDSLDMLQEYLDQYQGTLVVVSHDRDFLDNVSTAIISFEGGGRVEVYEGNYSEYVNYKESFGNKKDKSSNSSKANEIKDKAIAENVFLTNQSNKLSKNKIQTEINKTLQKIARLEKKIQGLTTELSDTEDRSSANLAQISIEISKYQKELDEVEARWVELEADLG